jgi:LmbE family N-acetylglucosaminyl deacetylase
MEHDMVNNILVVAAHPDDEVLGCGGTIRKHIQNGDNVSVLILSDGVTSRNIAGNNKLEISERNSSCNKANKILGVKNLFLESYSDNQMDKHSLLDIVKKIEEIVLKLKPNILYTHHNSDINIDHRITHDAVIVAARPQPESTIEKLLFFEIPSSTEWRPGSSDNTFNPNWFEDITETIDVKIDAINCYEAELREFPHPRSIKAIKALATWRGASISVEAAEAFVLGRCIN